MTLIKWTHRPVSIFDGMDSMISNVFDNDWNFQVKSNKNWSPSIDIKESKDSFTLTADIPGLTKKDVKVNISDNVLTISGERVATKTEDSESFHYRERNFGTFKRSFNLPDTVIEDDVKANFKNGILTIDLPKHEVILPKEREVKIN